MQQIMLCTIILLMGSGIYAKPRTNLPSKEEIVRQLAKKRKQEQRRELKRNYPTYRSKATKRGDSRNHIRDERES